MKSFCTYYNEKICQSCSLIESDYLDQLHIKEKLLLEQVHPMEQALLLPTVESKEVGFRNKAKMTVTGTMDNPIIGLIDREILGCPLHHPRINDVILELKDFIRKARLEPYQITSKRGELKGLILFYSETSDEMYLRLVLRSKEAISRLQKYIHLLQEKFPFLSCISANIQPIPHAILEGAEEVFLTNKNYIHHQLGKFHFEINPQAFVQTNQEIAQKLYMTAADWVKEIAPEKFAELFCGQGAFSFFVAPHVKEGLGIEINKEAIIKARQMAVTQNLGHLRFICADAASVASELESFIPDLVLVNPPRKGLGKSIDLLTHKIYPHVIYSSCSYETLGSDLKTLEKFYHVRRMKIFDMFPHTHHFETLVLLERK